MAAPILLAAPREACDEAGMRRSKEIMVLLALLVGAMGFVLWYVIDRRAKNRATPPPAATRTLAPEPPAPASPNTTPTSTPPPPQSPATPTPQPSKKDVTLGAATERKTLDFSSGQPVVKDSAADRAAIDEAMKDIAAASKEVTFEPTPKPKAAPPAKKP